MSAFRCEKCGCIENTAVCGYWWKEENKPALCSECDPEFGKWHGFFPKRQYKKGDNVLNPPKKEAK